jgi:hypothetical protein
MESLVPSLETAKAVQGMPSYYIFPDGRIYSTTTRMFVKPYENQGKPNQRYLVARLQEDGVKKTLKLHRLVAEAFISNPSNLPTVNHKDGNKLSPHVDNLEWVSASDNLRHAYATGLTSGAGAKNGNAKLTEEEVADIRSLRYQTSSTELSRVYGVAPNHIKEIWRGNKWKVSSMKGETDGTRD